MIVIAEDENNKEEGTIMAPSCSPMEDLLKPEALHGLAERIVAVESLIFLSRQYQLLQEYLEYLVPHTNKIMLQQFFTQVRVVLNKNRLGYVNLEYRLV